MRGTSILVSGASIWSLFSQTAFSIDVDISSDVSLKSAASTAAHGMMQYYSGNNTGDNPGNLPDPYYWWEAGAMFGTMVEYWYYTGDTSYNEVVMQALTSQVGDEYDYMPENQTKTEGNDDQGFWGMAAMSAAEMKYEDPPSDEPGWVALAQGVFNSMTERWDETTCKGGLRWQIFTFNNGYSYKNSIANGVYFNIAARLARYTGNQTYADWAEKSWDWMESVGLIGDNFEVYDGTTDTDNCTSIDHVQFSYNQGIFLFGAAMMYNHTDGSDHWLKRVNGLVTGCNTFFVDGVMSEVACEPRKNCNTDQKSFKAYLSRWMAGTAKLVPSTYNTIMPLIKSSASAAAAQCSGGEDGVTCGTRWIDKSIWDGTSGVGQQMAALSIMQSLLIDGAPALVTNTSGGTSQGNPNAGSGAGQNPDGDKNTPATAGDKAGAGILTALMLSGVLAGVAVLVVGD